MLSSTAVKCNPFRVRSLTRPTNSIELDKFFPVYSFAQEVNTDGDAALDKDEFATFFKSISTRKEIVNLMKQCSTKGANMTVEDFQYFLVTEQGVS